MLNFVRNKIGIGLCCFERYDLVSKNCKFLSQFLNTKFKIVVSDDGSRKKQNTHGIPLIEGQNMGVSINKNRILHVLQDCDVIFIIEDDVEIKNLDFIKIFSESSCQFLSYGPIETWKFWKIISNSNGIIEYTTSKKHCDKLFYTPGSFTAIKKSALLKVGGLNCGFKGLGFEHMEWAYRFKLLNLSMDSFDVYRTFDLSNSLGFFETPRNKRDVFQSKMNEGFYYKTVNGTFKPNYDYQNSNILGLNFQVFGIGLSKTGTNSLNEALNLLKIKSIHYPINEKLFKKIKNNDFNWEIMNDYQAITDITTIPFYKNLYNQYPVSKFVLTCRDLDNWLKSIKHHWEKGHHFSPINVNYKKMLPMTQMLLSLVYGGFDWDENRFKNIYKNHLFDVENFFLNSNRLLKIDICDGESWDKLCHFLNKPKPNFNFPNLGKRFKKIFI